MVDLGVYNFVKKALADGKSAEDISGELSRGGMSAALIQEAIAAAHSGTAPAPTPAPAEPASTIGLTPREPLVPATDDRGVAAILWLALFFSILGALALYFRPQLTKLHATLQQAHQQYESSIQ